MFIWKKCKEMPDKFRPDKCKKKGSAGYILLPVTYDFLTVQIHNLSEDPVRD